MLTFLLYTLGCKVNQYESQYVREGLERLGFREAESGEKVDFCVVNTCTITAESDLKGRKIIRQYARQHPEAAIVVMGCYATRAPEELAALPGVVRVLRDKADLARWLGELGLAEPPKGIAAFGPRHRAFVKVQDGCRQKCSYCIIPFVRPILRSRPPEEALNEVQRLVSAGYREIVLTGIHLGQYGVDLPSPRATLAQLVEQMLGVQGDFRIRLSSLEALELTPELLRLMAENPDRLCPHLHLPLQSGSDRVLQQMGRPYRVADFFRLCDQVRACLDHPALTTDVLIGFPGETEEDFQATCRAVERAEFSKLHIFPFSPRPGTRAAQLPDRTPPHTLRRRCGELAELGAQLRRRYLESLLGRKAQVLVEEVFSSTGEKEKENRPKDTFYQDASEFPFSRGLAPFPASQDIPFMRRGDHTPPNNTPVPLSDADCSLKKPSYGAEEYALVILRGTSERYAPVQLLGPMSWIGQQIPVTLEALVQEEQELALWAIAQTTHPKLL